MIRGAWKKWFSQLWHPSDEDLIAFLDGEAAGEPRGGFIVTWPNAGRAGLGARNSICPSAVF